MRKTLPHIQQLTTGILIQVGQQVHVIVEEGDAVPLKKEVVVQGVEGEVIQEMKIFGEMAGERTELGM